MTREAAYSLIYLFGGIAELALLGTLLVRRRYREFPVFTSYIAFNILSDILVAFISTQHAGRSAGWAALLLLPPQYVLELAVVLEIAWRVLQPIRPSLPSGTVPIFVGLLPAALAAGLILAGHVGIRGNGVYERVKFPLDLAIGFLRMIVFAVTAAFAQALGIGWKDRVLRLATALSFYSAVDLIVSLIQSRSGQSQALDHLRGGAYLLELGFLVWTFTAKETSRRQFSPQMHASLVALSAQVRTARASLSRAGQMMR